MLIVQQVSSSVGGKKPHAVGQGEMQMSIFWLVDDLVL